MTTANGSEEYLGALCRRSFLRLWSWPNVYRDQRAAKTGDGKELCDLLVVFGHHIFIFSDKYCRFPETGDQSRDWARWFKQAVLQSAKQIWGAERWLRKFPDRLFIDRECRTPFPITLPSPNEAVFHRIVVAHGSGQRCRAALGGSGSLMLVPEMVGGDHYDTTRERFLPFAVGTIDPSKGFVHVIDDFSLDVLLKTVDTAEDLARYLQQKESLVLSRRLGHAAGEEDLLAYYLSRADKGGQHYFDVPADSTAIFIGEGFWESFQSHPDRLAQIEADRVSYAWDDLIEKFTQHLLGGTQYYQSDPSVPAQEVALRFLAAERRFHRRILAKGLRGLLQLGDTQDRATRVVLPRSSGDPCYVFLSFKPRQDRTPEQYRTVRRNILGALCMVTRMRFPDARHIVGIATEPWGTGATRSEDFVYLDGTSWDDEQAAEAARLQTEFGFLTDVKQWKMNEPEYPRERDRKLRKGRNRNRACPCGSGRKYKKCCGLL